MAADEILTGLLKDEKPKDLTKLKVNELVDAPAPLNLVVTQVSSIGSYVMWHPAFVTDVTLPALRGGIAPKGSDGRLIRRAQTTLRCPLAHHGGASAEYKYVPSDVYRGFVGICVSNTRLSPLKTETSSRSAKRQKVAAKQLDERMTVAVAGQITIPFISEDDPPKPGDLVAFARPQLRYCAVVKGTEGREVPEIMPPIGAFDADAFSKGNCSAPFAVCTAIHVHTDDDPRSYEQPETITLLLRMDLYNVSKA